MSKLYTRKVFGESRRDRSGSLYWRIWDDEAVVYDSASGSTHLLDPLAAEALNAIYQYPEPLSPDQLTHEIAAEEDVALQHEIRDRIDEIVFVFEELGLIEATS